MCMQRFLIDFDETVTLQLPIPILIRDLCPSWTHRAEPSERDADLQREGHADEVLVLGLELVNPTVLIAAVLSVPLARVLVVVEVEPVVEVDVAKQGPAVHVDRPDGASWIWKPNQLKLNFNATNGLSNILSNFG